MHWLLASFLAAGFCALQDPAPGVPLRAEEERREQLRLHPLPEGPAPAASGGLAALEAELVELYRTLQPSLVEVETELHEDLGRGRRLFSSGVVLDDEGLVVAPMFVPQGRRLDVDRVVIHRMDGASFPATVVRYHAGYDLALLRAEDLVGLGPRLARANFLAPGSITVAMGNAYGLPGSFSLGHLTGLRRKVQGVRGLMQITNPVNPGDGGGILANRRGEVIGVLKTSLREAARAAQLDEEENDRRRDGRGRRDGRDGSSGAARYADAEGVAFAIPIDVIAAVFAEDLAHLLPPMRVLGVEVVERLRVRGGDDREPAVEHYVLVEGVMPEGPAGEAGVHAGDELVSLGGRPVRTLHDLGQAICEVPVESALRVRRGGEVLGLPVDFDVWQRPTANPR